ncbi:MAG: hypothetical protein KGH98_01560 [Candidatus Micrarchaeota archaeon]|nr:hypothetical protein [Candidatus Micrarchaeota archaeon]
MHKGIVAYIIIVIAILVVWYLATGFAIPSILTHKTTASSTTTIKGANTTTVSHSTTTTTVSANLTAPYIGTCDKLFFQNASPNTGMSVTCTWPNYTTLGLWMAFGNTGSGHILIKGADGRIYADEQALSSCVSFIGNYTLPHQVYTVTFRTGNGGGTCGYAIAKLNYSTTPPATTYDYVYNGNFTTGTYVGWTLTNPGFGTAPMNISYADANKCYLGAPWSGYGGTFFATTYTCGLSVAPGNITSSAFSTSMPFLNFKIISPQSQGLYVEILYNNSPAIIAHYNTFNATSANAASTFRNASIPLSLLANKPIRIKVVANLLQQQNYIAVTGFNLASTPHQDRGILVSLNNTNLQG